MRVLSDDYNGAGDKVNILPVLRLLQQMGHEVHTHLQPPSIYENTGIKPYIAGIPYDAKLPCSFEAEKTVPADLILKRIKDGTGIDLTGQYGPGLAFSEEEMDFIEMKKALEYVMVFPYTNVAQKAIHPNIARAIVQFLLGKGFNVCTSPAGFDNNKYPWREVFEGARFMNMYPYFDRRWLLDIAGARLNVCLDGGPFNVSLATGVNTVGLLGVADKRLAQLYPPEQWRVSQSTIECSPCFKCVASDEPGKINGCLHPTQPCGEHFDLEDVFKKIEELLW